MFDVQELCIFLVKAKKSTYASGENAKKIMEKDTSTSLIFKDGDWKYHDNYFGGEPYGGREIVFFKENPIYIMTYYGWVKKEIQDFNEIYKILQQALLLIPKENHYRGPQKYIYENYTYTNNFSGEEIIKYHEKEIYKAKYIWGLVNQRKEI
jgi:hypothetical protein